jgi:PAS domain S-box-containing protein
VAEDITERKRAETALHISEERLSQAVRVGDIGIFDHDHITDAYYWSAEHLRIYGLNEAPTLEEFVGLIHSEDRERIAAAVRRAHDPAGDGLFDVEFRGIRRDGAVRWISSRSKTFFDGEGGACRPVRTVGAVRDITEERLSHEALEQAKVYAEKFIRIDIQMYGRCSRSLRGKGSQDCLKIPF